MAVENIEIETYFGKCKCCLNYGYLRTMWEPHIVDAEKEIYGKMLTQCFSIEWTVATSEEDDQICEECIWKVREAHTFKTQVLRCQKQMEEQSVAENELEMKSDLDNENYDVEYLDEDILDNLNDNRDDSDEESAKDSHSEKNSHSCKDSQSGKDSHNGKDSHIGKGSHRDKESSERENDDDDEDNDADEDYYPLKDGEELIPDTAPRKRRIPQKDEESESGTEEPKPKWPKQLPKQERWKTYKQYSEDAMKDAFNAVTTKRMNQNLAAKHYHVPRKTLSAKIRAFKNDKEAFPETIARQFLCEVKSVLAHLNVTPFRSRNNQPICFYCVERNAFPTHDELRDHTSTHNRTELDKAMRPSWTNEIVKLDIRNMACSVCDERIPKWNDACEHLKLHDVNLEYKNKMIPFMLGDNRCTICGKDFSAFMLLDSHMNSHFNNFVCGHCGVSFVTYARLKKHEKKHSVGVHQCLTCNKVFPLEKSLKKHTVLTHTNELKVKCQHCTERFKSEHKRQAHIVKQHPEYVEYITCEICGMVFDWIRVFTRHMKRSHGTGHSCGQCGNFFASVTALREHQLEHTGVKEYRCLVCHKKYDSHAILRSHMKNQHKNIVLK